MEADSSEHILAEALKLCTGKENRALLEECAVLLPVLRARIPPRLPGIDAKIAALYDAAAFRDNNSDLREIFRNGELSRPEKCAAVLPLVRDNLAIIRPLRLPEELRRDDCDFIGALGVLASQARTLLSWTEAEDSGIDPAFAPLLRDYIAELDRLLDEIRDGTLKLKGLPRPMTPEEAYVAGSLEDALYDGGTPLTKRLLAAQKLWRDPLLGQDERVAHMETAVELIHEHARLR